MNIYVGNLAYSVTETSLKELFSSYGEVSEVNVISDRVTGQAKGFGFVVMPNDQESLTAIKALDGSEFQGRSMKVNQAKPRNDRF